MLVHGKMFLFNNCINYPLKSRIWRPDKYFASLIFDNNVTAKNDTKNAYFFNTEIIEFRNIFFIRGGGGRANYYVISGGGSARTLQSTTRGREGGKNPPKSHYVVCERPQRSVGAAKEL